jgi:hypothetical protein
LGYQRQSSGSHRIAAIAFVALVLHGCATSDRSVKTVQIDVAGPPIEASETGQAFLYDVPTANNGEFDGGRSSQHWSMLGREDRSAAGNEAEYKPRACAAEQGSRPGLANVIDAIAKRAASHKVVIINESHTVTRHRETTRQLLPKLRSLGFTVFAAETFTNGPEPRPPIDDHANVSWVHRNDGYYSREPVFGRLIRDAKGLGYRLAAYEHFDKPDEPTPTSDEESIRRREAGQAENLAKIISSMGPDERLLVHVGYSHAKEASQEWSEGNEILWMAGELKNLTGIDPLTVVQTECRSDGGEPFLAISPDQADSDWYDMIVSHPVDVFADNRPVWRRAGGDIEVSIPDGLRLTKEPLIIEAFMVGDPFDAVPIDRIYVEPDENLPLLLPPGRYVARAVKIGKE